MMADTYATGLFDASGRAEVRTDPVPWGDTWHLTSITVSTDIADNNPRTSCTVYRNSSADSNRVDVTKYGGNGDTTDTRVTLHHGESLLLVWEGGTVGARATVTTSGTVERAGGR